MVYFYSPETNVNNFKSLKMAFDKWLSGFGNYEFQPFSEREVFENHIKYKKEYILILSSWHYSNIYKLYSLKPALTGLRAGKKYQKKILVGKSAGINTAKGGQIASAGNIQYSRNSLTEIFREKEAAERAKILTVPKDIDALMSVSFGMSEFALTTEFALESLKTLNPALYKNMKVVGEGKESLLLLTALPENSVKTLENLVNIIYKMPETPEGKSNIKMLGLDGWGICNLSDKSTLEDNSKK